MKSLGAGALGAAAGTLVALVLLAAYTAWLFAQGPSSRDVLVSTWLLAWPAVLLCLLGGFGLGSGLGRTGRRSR